MKNNNKSKIVFFGTPGFVVPILKTLEENFNLVGVVTAPDRKVGRKQILTPSPVKLASQGLTLQPDEIFTPEKLDQQITSQLLAVKPDLFIVAAYGKIIPKEILNLSKFGGLNIHPSLLPKYRGPSPIQFAILNGEKVSGITIIKMDEKMDHGPVVFTKKIRLSKQDTFETLSKKMFTAAANILIKIIPDFVRGKTKPVVQDDAIATYCHIVKKEDGYFDISQPPTPNQLDKKVRAYFPWPGVWTKWSLSCHPFGSEPQGRRPERLAKDLKIVKFYPGGTVQMEGKNKVKLEDFLNGYPDFPIKKLK